jgi:hypothetical protein
LLRLYLDEDSVGRRVVAALTQAGFDVLTSGAAGNDGSDDERQLRFSSANGRVLVTANKKSSRESTPSG